MSADLSKYHAKRNFGRTPEPRGEAQRPMAERPQFVVQKHDARRLHYDVRLEHDGVLKSWAVPKGPSLDPKERRLAVQTEDHPLEYATFEGVIPEREYGAGAVLVWDRGHWVPESDPDKGLARGKLDFTLHGEKLRGRWTLVRLAPGGKRGGDQDNWLLIKRRDREARGNDAAELVDLRPESVLTGRDIEAVAAARDRVWHSRGDGETSPSPTAVVGRPDTVPGARPAGLPRNVVTQRPSPADQAPDGNGWLHEPQLDGARVLVSVSSGRTVQRGPHDVLAVAPIRDALLALPCDTALVDAIAVVYDERGVSDRAALDRGLDGGEQPDRVVLVAVDLLYLDGWDLRNAELRARKELLRLLATGAPPSLRYGDHVEGHGAEFHREACRLGLRGVVSKKADAAYRGGQNRDWIVTACAPPSGETAGRRHAKTS